MIRVSWISLPDLLPNLFARKAILSISSAVGKSLSLAMATKNHTRPSYVLVKIKVDLVAKLSHSVNINEENNIIGEVKSKWIYIQYDHKLKYCKE